MRYCTNCGKKIDGTSKFCSYCGASVSEPIEESPDSNNCENDISLKIYCPKCGSGNIQTVVKTDVKSSGKNFSTAQGCCGWFMFGPIGILCGSCGQKQKISTTNTSMFSCNDCGNEFFKKEEYEKRYKTAKTMKLSLIPAAIICAIFLIIMIVNFNKELAGTGYEWLLPTIFVSIFVLVFGTAYVIYNAMEKEAKTALETYEKAQQKFSSK